MPTRRLDQHARRRLSTVALAAIVRATQKIEQRQTVFLFKDSEEPTMKRFHVRTCHGTRGNATLIRHHDSLIPVCPRHEQGGNESGQEPEVFPAPHIPRLGCGIDNAVPVKKDTPRHRAAPSSRLGGPLATTTRRSVNAWLRTRPVR